MELFENFLKENPLFGEEEIKTLLNYQRAFPSLQDTSKEATVDGRTLWEELKVKHEFNDWIKGQLSAIESVKGKDYYIYFKGGDNLTQQVVENMSPQQRSACGISVEYTLTLECAKNICMVVGVAPRTNAETKRLSKLTRKYFIMMERIVKKADNWELMQLKSKKLHKQMMATYEEVHIAHYNRKPRDYGTLQEDIYYICFDMSTKELKDKLDIKYHQTVPEWVEEKIEKALCYTYSRMIVMLEMGIMDKDERFNTVAKMFDKKFGGVIEI